MKAFPNPCLRFIALAVALTLCVSAATPVANDPVMKAMSEELARSVDKLQLENLEKPYFISYRTEESSYKSTAATFGSLLGSNEGGSRNLTVEVRVGSPALDNTNFAAGYASLMMMRGNDSLPLDNQVQELRRQIWLATDQAYKSAVETLSKKKAALQNKTRTDETPDFSPQPVAQIMERKTYLPIDMKKAASLVREVSAAFKQCPEVANSVVHMSNQLQTTWYVNSEGSSSIRDEGMISFIIQGTTQAADGFPLTDHYAKFVDDASELPAKEELVSAALQVGKNLEKLKQAPLIEQFNGPVLFEDQAAVELFAQVFASNLCGKRRTMSDGTMSTGMENPFLDKIGARVLPDFLSVSDDATIKNLGSQPLLGSSKVDDEGVPTRLVKLVENGRLKTLLVTRTPVRGVMQSTGSARDGGPSISNLIVTTNEGGMDAAALKAEYLKTLQQRNKDYGFIIRRISSPHFRLERLMMTQISRDSARVEPSILAYKVYPDGREELVRNIEVAGMNVSAFKDITAAGRDPFILTGPFRSNYGGGASISSIAVPSMIFDDITLKKPSGEIPKPQVAKHPSFQ